MMGKHHGFKHPRVYTSWCLMKGRCSNPKSPDYPRYGGRGIKVCERWKDFRDFLADMGEPPEGMSIERVDNSKGYAPSNCVWATATEQAFNRRSNRLLTIDSITKPMSLWADEYSIPGATLRQRITVYGWSPERAVKTPVRRNKTNSAFCDTNGIHLTETIRGGFHDGANDWRAA
jgi:hypothetical protein